MNVKRITTALIGFPLVALVLILGNIYIVDIAFSAIAILSLYEYFHAFKSTGKANPIQWVGYILAAAISLIHVIPTEYTKNALQLLMPSIVVILFLMGIVTDMKINVKDILNKYNIKGVVISNLSQIEEFKNIPKVANYTLNIANNYSINELKELEIIKYTVSPEFEKETISNLSQEIEKEIIVYGKTLLMTTEYCMIGVYHNCPGTCTQGKYKLKDRMGFEFPICTDRINCNNFIYNSKITSIEWKNLNVN